MQIVNIERVRTTRGQEYDVTLETGVVERFTGITTQLGVIDKPGLKFWAANEERKWCVDAAYALYAISHNLTLMSRQDYAQTMRDRLGRGFAFNRTLKRSQDTGLTAHAACEHWARVKLGTADGSGPTLTDEAAQVAFMSFQDWAKSADLRPHAAEMRLCSLRNKFAGTADLIATVNGHPTLIDFKTSKAIYTTHLLQCCAYHVAYEEMGHGKLDGALVVRLPKDLDGDCECEVVPVPSVEELWPGVEAALKLWQFLQTREAAA